ncbi:ATP-dependent Clp protease proteolytic subunit [Streptomyces beigongshangae]|uniref:ATP-dependent Clp protease proteolytic subunit n=1 Tax=Streptomyces beigongshangae TaxID=2841597 RepID=UPI001C861AE2|nr:ATP-dependent Clp protease proteolytic subunit [Streptomyces sp. REN17]
MTRPSARHDLPRSTDPYSRLLEERTVRLGQAGVTAAVLLAAGTPGRRYALPGARVLVRQPSLPDAVRGQVSDPARRAGELTRTRARLEEVLARHTGRGRERIAADIERDRTLDARAAPAYGLVDRIVPGRGAVPGASGTG